jgi:hypothetical protein
MRLTTATPAPGGCLPFLVGHRARAVSHPASQLLRGPYHLGGRRQQSRARSPGIVASGPERKAAQLRRHRPACGPASTTLADRSVHRKYMRSRVQPQRRRRAALQISGNPGKRLKLCRRSCLSRCRPNRRRRSRFPMKGRLPSPKTPSWLNSWMKVMRRRYPHGVLAPPPLMTSPLIRRLVAPPLHQCGPTNWHACLALAPR